MYTSLRSRQRIRIALRVAAVLFVLYLFLPSSHPPAPAPGPPNSLLSKREPKIQHRFPPESGADVERLRAIKSEFLHAYRGYRKHAWKHDELKPVSGGTHTQYCGWAATLIDTLDTLYIMELYDEFEEAVQAVSRLSFSYAPSILCSVNPFEMTIRHLGGLLSAYDVSGEKDERLKQKAVEVGDMLFHAFGKNGIQCRTMVWPRIPGWTCEPSALLSLVRLGSQTLEFIR
jgi:mannosyl-oligosaccharide alpha-1,2-mannosidase